jgi:hypothetical protein
VAHQLKVSQERDFKALKAENRRHLIGQLLARPSPPPALAAIRRTAILQTRDRQSFERKGRSICVIF